MAEKKEKKEMSVVVLPLKTEPWQADRLTKMMENCRAIYNAVLGQKRKEYRRMLEEPSYKEALAIVSDCYKDKDKKRRKSQECKDALDTMNQLRKDYGITEYGFGSATTYHRQHYKNSVSSMIAQMSITPAAWKAFDSLIFGKGEDVHFKKAGDFSSMASDGRSGFRLVDEAGKTLERGIVDAPMFLAVGGRGIKKMTIPVIVPKDDSYKQEMVARSYHVIRVVKKTVRGVNKFYLQLTVDGVPAVKRDAEGKEKHLRGKGKVGIYIDTRTVTVITEAGELRQYKLNEGIDHFEEEKKALNRFMSHSRILSNPDNFEENGTIKKGVVVDGVRRPLEWHNSKRYHLARAKKADLHRVESETRRLERIRLANEILSLGNVFYINDFPFAEAARRKQEDALTKKGTPASKAKAGKAIGENAPSVLITFLKNKLEASGEGRITVVKIVPDRTGDYRTRYAGILLEKGEELAKAQEESVDET